jgi:hypothetical protein
VVPTLIYLDTMLWNRLLDQGVDSASLLAGLRKWNASLAVSGQTTYELARTFRGSAQRGQRLFQYLKLYVDAGIVGAHDNMELLHGEVTALNTGARGVVAYYSPDQYQAFREEVGKLADGIVDDRARTFIADRRQFSSASRAGQKTHLQSREDMRTKLTAVAENRLEAWLDEQILNEAGAAILAGHLLRIYEGLVPRVAIVNAIALLRHPASRIAKGVVRADLYFNWRCANRGSNPKDLVDDIYHVLNASYCDFYATAEEGQAEYAHLLLSQWTRVAVYDDKTPVENWLLSLVAVTNAQSPTSTVQPQGC